MMKVAIILGTRPEIIRLSTIIKKCSRYFETFVIHTGQNYDPKLSEVFFKDLDIIEPTMYLNCDGTSLGDRLGKIISHSYDVLQSIKPDAVLILGDTNSALAAISAKRLKIPIFHLEAGNRSFDINVPEEINRKIVDHISDLNMTYSQISKQYLVREGILPDRVVVTGSPLTEVLANLQPKVLQSSILNDLNLTKDGYILLSVHREENVDQPTKLIEIFTLMVQVHEHYKLPILCTLHPRTKDRLLKSKFSVPNCIQLHSPFGYLDYLKLQMNSFIVISDSGTISEEANILGFPAINLRSIHERPEAFEEIAPTLSLGNIHHICMAIEFQKSHSSKRVMDYTKTDVSSKVVNTIMSYTHVINKYDWRK